ncbi:MAG: hypothetical protein RBU37_11450 [Myxococcota bacterium]|nr:hypothetical protein [Myxococcota bacterium]
MGEQAKRPINKQLGGTGQAPNQQTTWGNRPSAQSTNNLGEQAKRPINKQVRGTGQAPNQQEIAAKSARQLGVLWLPARMSR